MDRNHRIRTAVIADMLAGRFSLDNRIKKMAEEYGELMEAWMVVNDPTSYKDKKPIDVLEEAIDVNMVARDILLRVQIEYDFSDDEVEAMFDKKLTKWERLSKNDNL